MKKFSFKILHQDKKSQARVGIIKTAHGEINTPAFVPVGTLGTVKSLTPEELKQSGCQVVLSNTYHLYLRPTAEVIKKLGGLHQFMNWSGPIITDSGGFQVFSLGLANKNFNSHKDKLMTKITDSGVVFHSHLDGSIHEFTPEKSIAIQKNLGSDILIAFDHCPPQNASYDYVKDAIRRTKVWAERCLQVKLSDNQTIYGVTQGGIYEDLRKQSAKEIALLNFPGFAIGGVAVGETKKEMYEAVFWSTPSLPPDKPRHLLGVGEIDDIFNCVKYGIDTFDCVAPTRIGRIGQFYTNNKELMENKKWQGDIMKSKYAADPQPLDKNCCCPACQHYSRAYLNHLFRNEELLGYRLLSLHNIYFLTKLLTDIRSSLENNQFAKLTDFWLQ